MLSLRSPCTTEVPRDLQGCEQLYVSHFSAHIVQLCEATHRLYVGDLCDNVELVLTYLLSGAVTASFG